MASNSLPLVEVLRSVLSSLPLKTEAGDKIFQSSVYFLAGYSAYYTVRSIRAFLAEDEKAGGTGKGGKQKLGVKVVVLKFLVWLRPEYLRLLLGISLSVASGYFEGRKALRMVDFVKTAIRGESLAQLGKYASKLLYYEALDIFVTWVRKELLSSATEDFVKRLKLKVFQALLHQEITFFDQNKLNKLKKLLDSDTKIVARFFTDQIPDVVDNFTSIFSQIVVLWSKSRQLTILMLASLVFQIETSKIKLRLLEFLEGEKEGEEVDDNSTVALSSIRAIRVFRREEEEVRKYSKFLFDHDLEEVDERKTRSGVLQWTLSCVRGFALSLKKELPSLANAMWKLCYKSYWLFHLWYGGSLSIAKQVDNEELQTLVEISSEVYDGITHFVKETEELQEIISPATRVIKLLERRPKISLDQGLIPDQPMRGELVLENISFKHMNTTNYCIENLSLKIAPGQRVALVGPSGSGKTTTFGLIHRFFDPASGRILVDGRDIREYNPHWYYKNIGFISQFPIIFNTTIEENIKIGNGEVDHERIVQVAKQVGIHDSIMELTQGYESNATFLAHGHQQMLSVARLLLSDPKLLLLDAPALGLDLKAEQIISEALEKLMKNRTCIIISHRLTEIAKCDNIMVFEHGHVIEEGNHQQLINLDGVYAKLVAQQVALNQDEANVEVPSTGVTEIKASVSKLTQILTKKKELLLLSKESASGKQLLDEKTLDEQIQEEEELVKIIDTVSKSIQKERERLAHLERKYDVVGDDLFESRMGGAGTGGEAKKVKPKEHRELNLKLMGSMKAVQCVNKFLKLSRPKLGGS